MDSHEITMEKIVSLCKRRGFVFQSSEIYGGQAGAWDYGPIGIELKKNILEKIKLAQLEIAELAIEKWKETEKTKLSTSSEIILSLLGK